MTVDQYKSALKILGSEYEKMKWDLIKKCVQENNPHKIGDIVTDHIGSVLVEKIHYSSGYGAEMPCAIYNGLELKKDGTPKLANKTREVFQSNLKK